MRHNLAERGAKDEALDKTCRNGAAGRDGGGLRLGGCGRHSRAGAARESEQAEFSYVPSCSLAEAEYVLREYEGCVAVFSSVGDTSPMTLTDIEVGTLREADRQILNTGLAVADREELLTLLEDLGS